jgi:O-antigen/teichoic acid export membrane protein
LLSSQAADAGQRTSRKVVALAMKANALAVLPVAALLAAASPLIMGCYGPGFREGWPTMVLTMLSAVVLCLQVPPVQAITASGRMWMVFLSYVIWGLAYVGLTVLMVDRGALGLAAARLVAYLLSAGGVFWLARYLWADQPPAPALHP